MSYEAWRISFQSSEQAARAAYDEAERLRADAGRYRWLRDEATWCLVSGGEGTKLSAHLSKVRLESIGPESDDFDNAIDAAMKGEG